MSLGSHARRLLAIVTSVVLTAALLTIPGTPWDNEVTPEADAQTNQGWGTDQNLYNNCSFRRGTGSVETYSGQLCWIDMSGVIEAVKARPSTQISRGDPEPPLTTMTKDLGRYTLTFDVRLREWNNAEDSNTEWSRWNTDKTQLNNTGDKQGGVFGETIGGNDYFLPYAGDKTKPILGYRGSGILDYNQMTKFEFRNIRLTDKSTGKAVTNYRLNTIDAQMTRSGSYAEAMSVHAPSGPAVRALTRITPSGYNDVCGPTSNRNNYGPGVENYYSEGDRGPKQFYCYEVGSGSNNGTFLVGGDGVNNLDVGLFSRHDIQAFALSLNMGRMAGGVEKPDTTMEQAATGSATSFDFKMATRLGGVDTPVPWQGDGIYTQALRAMNTSSNTDAADTMVFSSSAQGSAAGRALARYTPEWKCTTTTFKPETFTIKEGSVPAGFTLKNDAATGTSTLEYPNPTSKPVDCRVTWVPKYKPASLVLRKSVTGSAKNFPEVQNRRFTLGYKCAAPAGYTDAYPDVKPEGSKDLAAGESFQVDGLPAGSECTLTETFNDGNPPVKPGKALTLTWNGTGVTTVAADPVPTAKLTLAQGTNTAGTVNDVRANNNYDYRGGTVTLNKQILGEAVSSLGSPRDYRFELRCDGTDYARTLTMSATGVDDELNGSIRFDNVPVERDCHLRPLSGLSAEEGKSIRFDGREVTTGGQTVPLASDGTYVLRLPDYTPGATPTSLTAQIVARYSYEKRDVRVTKQVTGPAANLVGAQTQFTVRYRCQVPGDATSLVEGTATVTPDTDAPAVIQGVRVGADCTIFEDGVPAHDAAEVDRTTVTSSDTSDKVTTLTNDEAKSTPILKVSSSTDPQQNRAAVTNHYINKLGTVNLRKLVDSRIAAGELPGQFDIAFKCGTRTVETAPNTYTSVDLEGTVTIAGGGSTLLAASTGDANLDALVNNRSGAMGVPYGNTCTFSEKNPTVGEGILWSTDAASQKVAVDSAQVNATVTNTFEPAGNGVTVTQNQAGPASMFRDVTYTLACRDGQGAPVDLGTASEITLSGEKDTFTVDAATVLPGYECELTEATPDPGTRGDGWEIDRDSTASVGGKSQEFNDEAAVSMTFTVGEQTVLTVTHTYDYADKNIDVTKNVQFDEQTGDYISQVRKNVKYNRLFDFQLVCTPPDGGQSISVGGRVSSPQSNDPGSQKLSFDNIPDGSDCTATEGPTTAAEGIDFTQQVRATGQTGDRSLDFTVSGDTPVELLNTYSRRLATVEINKVANAPIDINASFPDTPKDQIYYTHTFTMVCTDPEGTAAESGALPEITPRTITGPDSTTFADIPVGADCDITGDKFGQLDLKKTENGVDLETHLRPDRVEWQVRRDDQASVTDTELGDGTTTLTGFHVKDNTGEGASGNIIDLTNYYQFVKSKMKMSKVIDAAPEDMKLAREAGTKLNFNFRCSGVGYSLSDINLPHTLDVADRNVFPDGSDGTYRFDSDEVEVPSGAWCEFTESDPSNMHAALEWKADAVNVAKRVGAENAPAVSYDFVNHFDRRTVPVRLAALQEGYLGGLADDAAYNYQVVCKDPGSTTVTESFALNQTDSTSTVADGVPPRTGRVVNLPVGVECTLELDGSALEQRPQLEVTAGDRAPYVQFGAWTGETALDTNPDTAIVSLTPDQVTPEMKKYSYTFTVPENLRSTAGEPVMTVAGEAMHLRDRVTLTFTKDSLGAAGEGRTFNFTSTCGEAFSLKAGESAQLENVEVDRDCDIQEAKAEEQDAPIPLVSLGEVGERIGDAAANVKRNAETGAVEGGSWTFRVLAAANATDGNVEGSKWSLTGVNNFPGIQLDKKIDGSPVSAVTGAVANTAILPDDAATMRFTYTVRNNGALPVDGISITEPSLAGKTVRAADGTEYTVGEDGAVPAEVCAMGGELAVDATRECSFDVVIDADAGESYSYRGEATATASVGGSKVSDTATYGAYRLSSALGFMLPDTGAQTLVLVLLLALALVGIGLWRYLRTRDDEDDELDG